MRVAFYFWEVNFFNFFIIGSFPKVLIKLCRVIHAFIQQILTEQPFLPGTVLDTRDTNLLLFQVLLPVICSCLICQLHYIHTELYTYIHTYTSAFSLSRSHLIFFNHPCQQEEHRVIRIKFRGFIPRIHTSHLILNHKPGSPFPKVSLITSLNFSSTLLFFLFL